MPEYAVVVDAIAATAAQNVIEITASTKHWSRLRWAIVTQDAQETTEVLPFQIHRNTVAGSGGAAVVPNRYNPRASLYSGTVARNNTTRGTEGEILHRESADIKDGFYFIPFTEREMPVIPPGGILVIGLEANPAASINLSATACLEEITEEELGDPPRTV
jgi:hypothetical protein